jgi:uncharacterized protein YfaS (alpha-2-macroglobulin family)
MTASRRRRFVLFAAGPLAASLTVAACFHGPSVAPAASLGPSGSDSGPSRSRGPFAVVYAAPRGHAILRQQPGITVLFSRGVRSVDMGDEDHVPALSVRTKDGGEVPGSWRWTGTRGLLFTPRGELPGGSDFTVTVPAGTRALDGAALEHPYTFTFDTAGPTVEAFAPVGPPGAYASVVPEQAMPAEASFRLQFDQPVDPAAVAAAARLRVYSVDGEPGQTLGVHAARESTPRDPNVPATHVVVLTPEHPLALDHEVDLTLDGHLHGVGGPRPMGDTYTHTARTHGPLRMTDFYCPRIEPNGRCRAGGDLMVTLSNPVSPAEFKKHVKAAAPPRALAKGEKVQVDPSFRQWLGVKPKLGAKYTVTLTAGMKDVYGQTLARNATFEVDVESPLVAPRAPKPEPKAEEPAASEANNDDTPPKRVAPPKPPPADVRPRRERLPYELDLGLVGHVLEAGGTSSGHRVPVGTVNIPTYASLAVPLNEAQATEWEVDRGDRAGFFARNDLTPTWTSTHTPENVRQVDFLDLDGVLAKQKGRGPLLLAVMPPGGDGGKDSLVSVTDLAVSSKMGPFGGLVWVSHLSSGKPAAGAVVSIRTKKDGEVFRATADAEGVVMVPREKFDPMSARGQSGLSGESIRTDAAIVAHAGDDWTLAKIERSPVESRLTTSIETLSKEGHWAGMLFTDRGVYRPGELAKVSGIVRVAEPDGLRSIAGRDVRVQLSDSNSEQIFDGRASCDAFGSFAIDVKIPKTAQFGEATVSVTAAPGGKSNTTESGSFTQTIRILEYKANEFKVAASSDQPSYIRGQSAVFDIEGDYLYGAPMPGATVDTTLSRQEVPFTPPGSTGIVTTDDVFTGDYADETAAAQELGPENGVLDEHGKFTRKVDLAMTGQKRPERVILDVDVQDLSRRTVSVRSTALVHPAAFYVGLKAPSDAFVAAGTPYRAEVVALDPAGVHKAGVKVKVELVERTWNGVALEQPDGTPARSSKAKDVTVGSCEATTSDRTAACDVQVPHAGYFIVRATAADDKKNEVRASVAIYGTESSPTVASAAAPAWPADDRHGLKLEENKKVYEIGDTAKVILRSPFRDGEALVTVERNGILDRHVVPIHGALPVVEVPVKPDYYPNVFVSVVAVRGRVQGAPGSGGNAGTSGSADFGGPDYRYGFAELTVNPEAHRLNVAVTTPKTEYHPGEKVEADVVVSDKQGKGRASALTFYAVDEGVLALTSYKTPDPLPAFVKTRKLAVFTFDTREQLARILSMKDGEKVPPLGYEYALASAKGYDKGGAGGGGDEPKKRAEFKTTAYFEAGHKTDANGRAHFSFKLPDNLTSFRLMAVAAGQEDLFGSGDETITTSRSLMARPALPRVLRVGDALEASVIISSKLPPGQAGSGGKSGNGGAPAGGDTFPADVSLAVGGGLTAPSPSTRRVMLARGGQTEVRFPLKATELGTATFTFKVKSAAPGATGKDADEVEETREIKLPLDVESAAVYGETSDEATIGLGALASTRKDFGGLDVHVAPTALVGIATTFDHLFEYPYGCTEQLTSRMLPLLSLGDLAKDYGAKLPGNPDAAIETGIDGLLKHQNDDGGFGFWEQDESDPWLSAYALLAVSAASDKKHFVPQDALTRARDYVTYRLSAYARDVNPDQSQADDSSSPGEGADSADGGVASAEAAEEAAKKKRIKRATSFALGAFSGDVLATIGGNNPGPLNVLFDGRENGPLFAQALLLHAMARTDMSPSQIKILEAEIKARLRIGASEVDVDDAAEKSSASDDFSPLLDSHARTLALVLRGLLAADPKTPLAAGLARKLLSLREAGAWRTTQEDSWALLALADYHQAQENGPPASAAAATELDAKVFLRGREILSTSFGPTSSREDKVFVPALRVADESGGLLGFSASGGKTLFYSAELRYATTALPTKPLDEGLFVQKYIRGVAATDVSRLLPTVPSKSDGAVNAGDLVMVDLLFETAEARDQVVIDDPLPAGLEALDYDLDTTSQAAKDAEAKEKEAAAKNDRSWLGTTYRTATARREVHDDRVVEFFDHLAPGMYRIHYLARATVLGQFVVPPTRIEAMYAPEVFGRTAASGLSVRTK